MLACTSRSNNMRCPDSARSKKTSTTPSIRPGRTSMIERYNSASADPGVDFSASTVQATSSALSGDPSDHNAVGANWKDSCITALSGGGTGGGNVVVVDDVDVEVSVDDTPASVVAGFESTDVDVATDVACGPLVELPLHAVSTTAPQIAVMKKNRSREGNVIATADRTSRNSYPAGQDAVCWTMRANSSGSRLAPPTRAPSMSGCAIKSAIFPDFTEPPY